MRVVPVAASAGPLIGVDPQRLSVPYDRIDADCTDDQKGSATRAWVAATSTMTAFTEEESLDPLSPVAIQPRDEEDGFLGFAIVDHEAGSGQVAVWLVSRINPAETGNTNAVVLKLAADDHFCRKIHAMTRQRIVLQTPGSDCRDLPLMGPIGDLSSLDAMVDCADSMLAEIRLAIEAYASRVRVKSLVVPSLRRPSFAAFPSEGSPSARALAAADMVRQAWDYWLRVEHERVRRTVQPKTGTTPWIMPPGLDHPKAMVLPPEWKTQATVQPLEPYGSGADFTAIDFETANSHRGSPCQVGLVKVRDGAVIDQRCWYIQPPVAAAHFDAFNVALHGITPDVAADAPPWRDVLEDVMAFIQDDLVVAHNAGFDISVLRQACDLDGIEVPTLSFLCTLTLARRALSLPSYRLPFVAAELGIPIANHHNALADAQSAAQIAVALAVRSGASNLLECARSHKITPGMLGPGSYRGSGASRPGGGGSSLVAGQPNVGADVDSYLYGRVVVFTGALQSMTRQQAWDAVTQVGGLPESNTTKRTNILVVGDIAPGQLAPGTVLTGKAKRAFELQGKGQQIELMTEEDFVQVVQTGS